jgi:hypothetical protein
VIEQPFVPYAEALSFRKYFPVVYKGSPLLNACDVTCDSIRINVFSGTFIDKKTKSPKTTINVYARVE